MLIGMDELTEQFSQAELSAMRLDGVLFSLRGSYLAVDEPDVLSTRVRIARGDAPPHLLLDRISAAWVWQAVALPPRAAEYCVDMAHRSSKIEPGTWRVRHVKLRPGEIVRTASGGLISPWRTVLHLLRWPPDCSGDELRSVVRRLIALEGMTAGEAQARFDREQAANVRGQFSALLADLLGV